MQVAKTRIFQLLRKHRTSRRMESGAMRSYDGTTSVIGFDADKYILLQGI